jgi:hypothetical protein
VGDSFDAVEDAVKMSTQASAGRPALPTDEQIVSGARPKWIFHLEGHRAGAIGPGEEGRGGPPCHVGRFVALRAEWERLVPGLPVEHTGREFRLQWVPEESDEVRR